MSNLVFRLRPADDPLGTLLAEYDHNSLMAGTSFRKALAGTGSGQLVMPQDYGPDLHDQGHVQVVDTTLGDGSDPAAGLLGGFLLGEGGASVVSEASDRRRLEWGGAGNLSILSRAVLLEEWYAPSPPASDARGSSQDPGIWRWLFQAWGGIVVRSVEEGQNQPDEPLAAVTPTFDRDVDSNGDIWLDLAGTIERRWGVDVLEITTDAVKAGMIAQMEGNLDFGLYQAYGTDRSSGTFAAGKVRFEYRQNIASKLSREIRGSARVSKIFVVGARNAVAVVSDPGAPVGSYATISYHESDDPDVLENVGEREVQRRQRRSDTPSFTIATGDDEAAGRYTPGHPDSDGHFWVGDIVRLHTGVDGHHYNEIDLPVAAINWTLTSGRKWEVTLELGATFLDRGSREFEEKVITLVSNNKPQSHAHPEMFCRAGIPQDES